MSLPTFGTLRLRWIDLEQGVLEVALNRPEKLNAVSSNMWSDVLACFGTSLPMLDGLRVVVLTGGDSKHFCAGIDISDVSSNSDSGIGLGRGGNITVPSTLPDVARTAFNIRTKVMWLQSCFDAVEKLRVPVVAGIHGACVGAGLDLISVSTHTLAFSSRAVLVVHSSLPGV